jgi:hypothetical protein
MKGRQCIALQSTKAGVAYDRSSNPEKNENVPKKKVQNAKSVKTHPQQEGTYYTIMAEYMSKMDSALLMVSTILHLVRNEKAKCKDRPLEFLAEETFDNDLEEVIAAANEPKVTVVADKEGPVKKTVIDDVKEITEAHTEKTANVLVKDPASLVMEPVNKDSEEYQQRIKNASNKFLAALGVLNKICPRGLHLGYAIVDCKCEVKVMQTRCPHRN